MSLLSPVPAISAMVAPVVLITVGGVFTNGLLTAYTTVADRVHELNREQVAILRAPDGRLLSEDEVTPSERERLTQVREQMPLIARRIRLIRNAVVVFSCSVGLLVLSVVAIGVAVLAGAKAVELVALSLVMAGTVAQFAGIVMMTVMAVASSDALVYETRRASRLG